MMFSGLKLRAPPGRVGLGFSDLNYGLGPRNEGTQWPPAPMPVGPASLRSESGHESRRRPPAPPQTVKPCRSTVAPANHGLSHRPGLGPARRRTPRAYCKRPSDVTFVPVAHPGPAGNRKCQVQSRRRSGCTSVRSPGTCAGHRSGPSRRHPCSTTAPTHNRNLLSSGAGGDAAGGRRQQPCPATARSPWTVPSQ